VKFSEIKTQDLGNTEQKGPQRIMKQYHTGRPIRKVYVTC